MDFFNRHGCNVKRFTLMLVAMALPCFALAEDVVVTRDTPPPSTNGVKVLTPAPDGQHFMPLHAQQDDKGLPLAPQKKMLPLRSDAQQMDGGFLRIDRAIANPSPHIHPITVPVNNVSSNPVAMASTTPAAPLNTLPQESEEIEGNNEGIDPVLALFGGGGGGAAMSFRDAMKGGGASSDFAGVTRHSVWPIPLGAKQYVSSGFGMRADPFNGQQTFHGGIDIAADMGTPVLATADATVQQVAFDRGYGNYITLEHADGMLSRYGHLSAQDVRIGETVKAGQVIGAVGATGRATGAHLDYRVSRNGMKFDPLAVLTIPSNVAVKTSPFSPHVAGKPTAPTSMHGVASNALPKHPMVIEVH